MGEHLIRHRLVVRDGPCLDDAKCGGVAAEAAAGTVRPARARGWPGATARAAGGACTVWVSFNPAATSGARFPLATELIRTAVVGVSVVVPVVAPLA